MKIYSKILGILSLISICSIIIILSIIAIEEEGDNRLIAISLFVPIYFMLHFLIVYRFGFTFPQDQTKKLDRLFIVASILSFVILLVLPARLAYQYVNDRNIINKLEEEYVEIKNLGLVTTAYSYTAELKTKFHNGDILYQLTVKSEKPFVADIKGFKIQLLDRDGFKIKEIVVSDFSYAVDENGTTFGISANSSSYISIHEYAKIDKWDLLITT